MARNGRTILAGAAVLLALGGCGGKPAAVASNREAEQLNAADAMIDTSPDSLSAPSNMAVEGESNDGEAGNGG